MAGAFRWTGTVALHVAAALFIALPAAALAQVDSIAQQKQAIERIDAAIENVRRNGDMAAFRSEVAQPDRDLTESNKLLSTSGEWTALAVGLTKQGTLRRLASQHAEALALYRKAEEAARRAGHFGHQADALAFASMLGVSSSQISQAVADGTRAVELADSTSDYELIGRALDALSSAQGEAQDFSAASNTAERSVANAAKARNPMTAYYALTRRGDVFTSRANRCDYEGALEICYQALDRAQADYQQALAIVQRLRYTFLTGLLTETISGLNVKRLLFEDRERFRKSTRHAAGSFFRPTTPSDVLATETFVRLDPVNPSSVLSPELHGTYERTTQQPSQYPGFEGFAYFRRAHLLANEARKLEVNGRHDEALQKYLQAIQMLQRDRGALHDDRSRSGVLAESIDIYYRAMLQLLQRKRHTEAFELLERSRSRTLADLLDSRKLGLGRPNEQRLYAEAVTLRSTISAAQGEMFELAAAPSAADQVGRLRSLQARVADLERQERLLASRIATEAPQLQELADSEPVTLEALQKSMREEGYETLQYVSLEDKLILWHITGDTVFVRNVFLPRPELIPKVELLQKSLSDREAKFDETTARELFLYLVQPVLSRLQSKRLVIVAHEHLATIPFQVLKNPSSGHFLGEDFQISYAPGASVLLRVKPASGASRGRLLAVADPNIQHARAEVTAIAKLFPGRSKLVAAPLASKAELRSWVGDFDIVHLAVHGKFVAENPLLSYLELAPKSDDNGRLTAAEMFGLQLKDSPLVVLSACETGRVEATHSNEILGMVRALLYAGAGTLVLSSWRVDSEATTLWMQAFYEAAQTRPLAEAAQLAMSRVKAQPGYSHPYFWAAFSMVGH